MNTMTGILRKAAKFLYFSHCVLSTHKIRVHAKRFQLGSCRTACSWFSNSNITSLLLWFQPPSFHPISSSHLPCRFFSWLRDERELKTNKCKAVSKNSNYGRFFIQRCCNFSLAKKVLILHATRGQHNTRNI